MVENQESELINSQKNDAILPSSTKYVSLPSDMSSIRQQQARILTPPGLSQKEKHEYIRKTKNALSKAPIKRVRSYSLPDMRFSDISELQVQPQMQDQECLEPSKTPEPVVTDEASAVSEEMPVLIVESPNIEITDSVGLMPPPRRSKRVTFQKLPNKGDEVSHPVKKLKTKRQKEQIVSDQPVVTRYGRVIKKLKKYGIMSEINVETDDDNKEISSSELMKKTLGDFNTLQSFQESKKCRHVFWNDILFQKN